MQWPIAHNLTRAVGALAGTFHARETTATIRAHLINVPARVAPRSRRVTLHLPAGCPGKPPGRDGRLTAWAAGRVRLGDGFGHSGTSQARLGSTGIRVDANSVHDGALRLHLSVMGRLIDRDQWEEALDVGHHHLLVALERCLPPSHQLQFRDWLGDGHSGARVAKVVRRQPEPAQLILKFCASSPRTGQLEQAVTRPSEFVAQHLAVLDQYSINLCVPYDLPEASRHEGRARQRPADDAHAVFMRIAGGDLERYQSLFRLRQHHPERSDVDYRGIVASLIAGWNDELRGGETRTARSIVAGIVGHRRGDVIRWIRRTPGLRSQAPLELLTGPEGRRIVRDVFIGKAHGDLNARNILLRDPSEPADPFKLIDYDHYSEDAPLARDPMHLLVGLALDDFDRQGAAVTELIQAIVKPRRPTGQGYFEQISWAIHEGCRTSFPPERGWADLWEAQCLLALVGVALRRVTRRPRTATPEVAQRWCYDLSAAAAERFRKRFGGTPSPPPPTMPKRAGIIDRYFEQQELADRLAHGPHGVVTVRGEKGSGKSRLVDAVIGTLSPDVRRVRQHSAPDYVFDVPALIEMITARPAGVSDRPGAALVRLEELLSESQDQVVIAVESADPFLDAETRPRADLGIDEAFALLNDLDQHRVSVVLEATPVDALPATGPDEDRVWLPRLSYDDFSSLLDDLDRTYRLERHALPAEHQRELWDLAQGLPRIAELIYACVCQAHVPLPSLLDGLREHRHTPTTHLVRVLVEGMHPLGRDLLGAVAALGTPVPVDAVRRMLPDVDPSRVEQALRNFRADRLLRAESDLFFLPAADARIVLKHLGNTDLRSLRYAAANALDACAVPTPATLADLRYRLAEIRALVEAGRFPLAWRKMRDVEEYLGPWNCTPVLLPYRLGVRGRLGHPELEKDNENALGGIYLATGDLVHARNALDLALTSAGTDADPNVLARLHANLASVEWESNQTALARDGYEKALQRASDADDRIAMMGAHSGLADCHRRHGEYAQAIGSANAVFDIFRSADVATLAEADVEGRSLAVGAAVRLVRWHAEHDDDLDNAYHWCQTTREITRHAEDRYHATYLNALADLQLHDVLRRSATDTAEVIKTAGRAIDLAFRTQDRLALLHARTTTCVAYLCAGKDGEAAVSIKRAGWHRPRDRHLVVLALEALTRRRVDNHGDATALFEKLGKEAQDRIALDTGWLAEAGGPGVVGPKDFGARHFLGFARCGLALAGRADLETAVTSFRMPEIAQPPYAPGLVVRMGFMLACLDASADRPGMLQPAIDALRDTLLRSNPSRGPA